MYRNLVSYVPPFFPLSPCGACLTTQETRGLESERATKNPNTEMAHVHFWKKPPPYEEAELIACHAADADEARAAHFEEERRRYTMGSQSPDNDFTG